MNPKYAILDSFPFSGMYYTHATEGKILDFGGVLI